MDSTLIAADIATAAAAALVEDAINRLNRPRWRVRSETLCEVRTTVTWKSFGEVVRAELKPAGTGTIVQVSSRSRVPWTVVDYGVNSDNVHTVIAALQERRKDGEGNPIVSRA